MNIQANEAYGETGSGLSLTIGSSDRSQALRRARRHSWLVFVLRIFLPLCAAFVLALYFLPNRLEIEISGAKLDTGQLIYSSKELKMLNPRLEGANEKQGTYVITADSAVQNIANTNIVRLNKVKANVTHPANGLITLKADKGRFNTKNEQLRLDGNIIVTAANGMTARLSTALINMNKQSILSRQPIRLDMPQGRLTADTMKVTGANKSVLFEGRVRLRLNRRPTFKPSKDIE